MRAAVERRRLLLDHAVRSLARRPTKNLGLVCVYALVVFLVGSVMLYGAAIRREAAAAPAGGTAADLLKLRFQCRPGRQYQVERVDTLLGEQVFVPVGGLLTAGADAYELETEVDLPEFRTGAYRLRLVVAP